MTSGRPRLDPAERKEIDYWKARRSLRFRPVGEGADLEAAVTYMRDHLRLDESFINMTTGKFAASRIPLRPKAKFRHDILVTFGSVEARDVVRGRLRTWQAKDRSLEFNLRSLTT